MDEEADLALVSGQSTGVWASLRYQLDQHLIKTNQLSQRMTGGHLNITKLLTPTGILSQLDARLSKLDKTISPLGIQPHYRHAQSS
jgi:exocyst complex protein 7